MRYMPKQDLSLLNSFSFCVKYDKFSFKLRLYVILTDIILQVMHERGKVSKDDENPLKNDKMWQKGQKNYLDMQNQIGLECISNNMNVFFLLNKTYLTNGVLIGPFSS